jgi:putative oxidoreductase
MEALFASAQRIAIPFLRISLGVILLWIGALKFVDPSPVVQLLGASLPFLAFNGFVYLLGILEVASALALFVGIGVRYVGLFMLVLFAGTLTIFLITPSVTGLPFLTLAGEFLLKDLVLLAATVVVMADDYAKVREKDSTVSG